MIEWMVDVFDSRMDGRMACVLQISQSSGSRAKEAVYINKSLSNLGNVRLSVARPVNLTHTRSLSCSQMLRSLSTAGHIAQGSVYCWPCGLGICANCILGAGDFGSPGAAEACPVPGFKAHILPCRLSISIDSSFIASIPFQCRGHNLPHLIPESEFYFSCKCWLKTFGVCADRG